MPTIYQGICGHCGHKTPIMRGGYGAVFVDQPAQQGQHEVAGAVIMSGHKGAMAVSSDPRFVILSHPLESSILAGTGYSWRDLLRQGRYVAMTNVIYRCCGTVFQRRRLRPPGATGCMTSLVIGVVGGAAVGLWWHSFVAGLLAWYAMTFTTLMLASFLASMYLRIRFANRAAALAAERSCPSCHADSAQRIERTKSATCPVCRNQSLRFVAIGRS